MSDKDPPEPGENKDEFPVWLVGICNNGNPDREEKDILVLRFESAGPISGEVTEEEELEENPLSGAGLPGARL